MPAKIAWAGCGPPLRHALRVLACVQPVVMLLLPNCHLLRQGCPVALVARPEGHTCQDPVLAYGVSKAGTGMVQRCTVAYRTNVPQHRVLLLKVVCADDVLCSCLLTLHCSSTGNLLVVAGQETTANIDNDDDASVSTP